MSLKQSRIFVGIDFSSHNKLNDMLDLFSPRLVFPSGASTPLELDISSKDEKLPLFIIIDGTWSEAKKIIRLSNNINKLPKVSITPDKPSRYRIRRQPARHCLSTIEVAAVLLNTYNMTREAGRLLKSFDAMVQQQIDYETESS